MTANDFCLWLKPMLDQADGRGLTQAETDAIRRKLAQVFIHEIDPAMGDDAHQAMLNHIHRGAPH
jgi:hypothetical protein